nr:hypothetical protein [Streptomyces sp. SA3_actF]
MSTEELVSGTEARRAQETASGADGEGAEATGAEERERPGGRARTRLVRRALAGLGIALALAVCAAGTWSYARARTDDDLSYGRARDAALREGRAAVATLSTLDASSRARAEAGVARWKTVKRRSVAHGTRPRETGEGRLLARRRDGRGAHGARYPRGHGTPHRDAQGRDDGAGRGEPTTDRKRLEAVLTRDSSGSGRSRACRRWRFRR